MTLKIKITMAVINTCCLLFTLFSPGLVTAISLIPMIVSALMWTYLTNQEEVSKLEAVMSVLFLLVGLFLIGMCVIVFFTCKLVFDSPQYVFIFQPNFFGIGGYKFLYSTFFKISLFGVVLLYLGEIIHDAFIKPPKDIIKDSELTFDSLVDETINLAMKIMK